MAIEFRAAADVEMQMRPHRVFASVLQPFANTVICLRVVRRSPRSISSTSSPKLTVAAMIVISPLPASIAIFTSEQHLIIAANDP